MMADERNPTLEALFAEPAAELADDAFVNEVMTQTRIRKYWLLASLASAALIVVLVAWTYSEPALQLARMLTQALTVSLFDVGDGWLAWILLPVNSVAGLLVLIAKAARMAWKRIFGIKTLF